MCEQREGLTGQSLTVCQSAGDLTALCDVTYGAVITAILQLF